MQVIVYRDGVGDGQLQMTIDHEVLQFRVRIIKTTDLTVIYGNLVRSVSDQYSWYPNRKYCSLSPSKNWRFKKILKKITNNEFLKFYLIKITPLPLVSGVPQASQVHDAHPGFCGCPEEVRIFAFYRILQLLGSEGWLVPPPLSLLVGLTTDTSPSTTVVRSATRPRGPSWTTPSPRGTGTTSSWSRSMYPRYLLICRALLYSLHITSVFRIRVLLSGGSAIFPESGSGSGKNPDPDSTGVSTRKNISPNYI